LAYKKPLPHKSLVDFQLLSAEPELPWPQCRASEAKLANPL